MALSARELVLILRATNQASGPMRQVARDLRSLGTSGVVAGRQIDNVASARRWAKFGVASAVLRDTGRSARIFGIAAGAGIGFAASAYADFQTQAGLVATQTGETNLAIGRTTEVMRRNAEIIEKGVLAQMRKFPAPAAEMNDALYEIFSSTELGSQGLAGVSNGLKVLNLMNRAAVAGQADLSDVTKATTSIMNAFGGGVAGLPAKLERMFAAVRFGRMTFADFVSTFSQIVPATQAADQSFDTMTGTMAALTRLMPNVRFAATAYARMLEIFGRKKFVDGAKKFGVAIRDQKGEMRPLPNIMADFRRELDKLAPEKRAPMIANFFKELSNTEGTIQARRAFIALIKHPELYSKVLRQTVQDQNEFTKSFRAMAETSGVKWKTFVNSMRATFIQLGAAAIPTLLAILEPLRDLFEWFNKLDKAQKDQVARWIAIGAAGAIVLGTLASIVGTIGTIIGPFKAFGGSLTVLLGTLTLIAGALLLIAGRGDLVKDALTGMLDAATSSAKNFAAALALITVGVVRLRGAVVASAATGALGTMGGLFAGAAGRARAGRAAFGARPKPLFDRSQGKFIERNLSTSARSANALKAAFAGSAIAAGGIAGALLPTVGIVAAIGGAMLFMKRDMAKAREEAERMAQIQARFRQQARVPARAAASFASFGMDVRDARRAELALEALDIQIKNLRRSAREASREDRPGIINQIKTALLDRAEAQEAVTAATAKANQTFSQMTTFAQGTINNLTRMSEMETKLSSLRERRAMLEQRLQQGDPMGILERVGQIKKLDNQIAGLEIAYAGLGATTAKAAQQMRTSFSAAMRDMMRAGILPKAPQRVIDDMLTTFMQLRKRAPTLKEARLFIQAMLDPRSIPKLDKDVQALIKQTERKRQLKLGQQFAVDSGQIPKTIKEVKKVPNVLELPVGLRPPKDDGKSVKKKIAATFKVASTHKINVVPPPPAALLQIGQSITAGIEAGITEIQQPVIQRVIRSAVEGFDKEGKGHSPYMLFAQRVGIPIVQGVIVGMLSKAGEAADAAVLVIDAIEGKSVKAMTAFLNKQDKLFGQMNTNLQKLVNRRVPMKLVEQLAQMGTEGAAKIKQLASASQSELNKFVNAWKRANAESTRSAAFNWTRLTEFVDQGAQKLLDLYNEARDRLRDFVMGALNDVGELGRRMSDAVTNAFGALFQGPQNIMGRIGPAFDEAMASYSSSMADLQGQMEELQQRQSDTIADFMERRRDELRQQFGRLFSGPILGQGFAAGSVRDLIADLNAQLKAFTDWRKNLDRLSARGLPGRLMRELEELGIEGSHNLQLLANSSDTELADFVQAWTNGQNAIEEVTQATYMNMEGFAEAMADIAKQMAKVAQQMASLAVPQRATFADIIADLQAQLSAWRDYNATLTALHERGVPGLLLAELAELGVEGIDILRLFNTATDAELATFISTWQTKQQELKAAKDKWQETLMPEEILSTLGESVDALHEFDAIIESLRTKLANVPGGQAIIKALQEMGPDALPLLRGLNQMTEQQLISGDKSFVKLWKEAHGQINIAAQEFVTAQVALWTQAGSDIANGLIAGVLQEQGKLLAFFRNMFMELLQEAKSQTKSKSPSQVYFELGRNIVQGFQLGLSSMKPELALPGTGSVNGAFAHRGNGGINMTVNAHHSESLSTTLSRAAFRMRQRRVV